MEPPPPAPPAPPAICRICFDDDQTDLSFSTCACRSENNSHGCHIQCAATFGITQATTVRRAGSCNKCKSCGQVYSFAVNEQIWRGLLLKGREQGWTEPWTNNYPEFMVLCHLGETLERLDESDASLEMLLRSEDVLRTVDADADYVQYFDARVKKTRAKNYTKLGRFDEAREALAVALTAFERLKAGGFAMGVKFNQGELWQAEGEYKRAVIRFRKLVATQESINGDMHRDTMAFKRQLAEALLLDGQVAASEEIIEEIVPKAIILLGHLHRDTVRFVAMQGRIAAAKAEPSYAEEKSVEQQLQEARAENEKNKAEIEALKAEVKRLNSLIPSNDR